MTKDFADFLESLNREGVAYVVIGGIAVLAHIPYRTTRDLDVLIEPTLDLVSHLLDDALLDSGTRSAGDSTSRQLEN